MTSQQRCSSCRVIRNVRDFLTINGSLQSACKNCCYLSKQRKAKDSRIKEYVKFPHEGNIMFLDTETNGLPVELDNFLLYDPRRCLKAYDKARMTSLAYIVTTSENMVLDEGYFVSSEDLDISQKITCLTGISKGDGDTPTRVILERLFSALENYDVKYLVAHNVEFDKNIVLSEMLRFGLNPKRWLSLDFKCTYAASGKKLEHCVEEFLAEKACNLHNAKADTEYCRKLFFWLKHRVRDRLGGLAVPK